MVLQVSVKVVRILQTSVLPAKDAGIVPRDTANLTVVYINNGRQEGENAFIVRIIELSQKAQRVLRGSAYGNICALENRAAVAAYQILVG